MENGKREDLTAEEEFIMLIREPILTDNSKTATPSAATVYSSTLTDLSIEVLSKTPWLMDSVFSTTITMNSNTKATGSTTSLMVTEPKCTEMEANTQERF